MIDLLLLWHMHQPSYRHPSTGRSVLPWVRLHAGSGYLDMARALERHPGAHVTVNFVPSLVQQIEELVGGDRDELELIAEKHADTLDAAERALVVERASSVRWSRAVEPRPRYAELLGRKAPPDRLSVPDLRDLECLFLLSWLGFAAREDEPAIDELDRKGRDFSEDDKRTLLAAGRAAAARVLPTWRRLAERGQVELCTSPYYHPIVPLLLDTNVAKRSRPGDPLPARLVCPDDARAQIQLARAAHERTFGVAPAGMWPPEGSLSPEAVRLYAECGVRWLAGDEDTLARSIEGDSATTIEKARMHVWRYADVDLVFRNHDLSDRIGFRYAEMPASEAIADLIASSRAAAGHGALVGLFLDGENAWEAYPRRGADFLDGLYAALEAGERAGTIRARTVGEAVADRTPGRPLERLHSGSWIDSSFHIWIGDAEKNRAWSRLAQTRDRVTSVERQRGGADPGVAKARRHLLTAEGSDWFWWFGEPFSSKEDPVFDDLFRAHLTAAWKALGVEPPADLAEPIMEPRLVAVGAAPTAFIHPHMDGIGERYFEWVGAARTQIGRGVAMADPTHPIDRVHLGFDADTLYMRLDPTRVDRRRVTASRMILRLRNGDETALLKIQLGAPDGSPDLKAIGGRVASLDVVEVALPFAVLKAKPRDEIRLWMTLEFAGVPFARIPRDGVLSVTVPWAGWEEEHWSA